MPAAARWTPPVTGASSVCTPRPAASAASRRSSCKSLVLMSIQVPPGASPSRMPPGPSTVAATTSGEGRQVMTVSAASAAAAAEAAQAAPAARRSAAASLLVSYTVSG